MNLFQSELFGEIPEPETFLELIELLESPLDSERSRLIHTSITHTITGEKRNHFLGEFEMTQQKFGITEKYSMEIQEIGNKLRQLKDGRVYELSGTQMDGYLATNIDQLKKMLSELIWKIDNQKDSNSDVFDSIY